jgi:hypothetical protein
MGFTLRSFLLLKGIRAVTPERTHLLFRVSVLPAREASGRPKHATASGLSPFQESLAFRQSVSPPDAGCSHGFLPFRALHREPFLDVSAQNPLTRFADRAIARLIQLRPRVSIGPRPLLSDQPCRNPTAGQNALIGFVHQPDPTRSGKDPPGLCIHLTSRRALLPTDRWSLEVSIALPQVVGTA